MQKSARSWALALLGTTIALIVSTIAAQAIDLNAGRRLTASSTSPSRSKISFNFTNDPGLFFGDSPICPTQTKIRFVTNQGPMAEQVLPCNGWSLKGSGFQFKDIPTAGSLRKVSYSPGRLTVTLKGFPYGNNPVIGPINFIETRVTIGTKAYCGRWEPPGDVKKNTPSSIVIKGPTTACVFACGNSILEPDEVCDDGDLASGDGCDSNCTPTGCGNGIQTAGEQCDDGNNQSGDGCSATCVFAGCGDGIQTPGEQCDDGNATSGDCCSSTCQLEAAGSACGSDGNVCTNDQCNGAGACLHLPNSSPCDDGDGCTTSDVCSGGSCGGTLLEPWVNEIDYDNNSIGNDTNEFIELAGPAGKNLSGYQVVVVEGANALCLTGGSAGGQAYSIGTLPNGTILPDDTGSGIGFLVVCFAGRSSSAVPGCDVTLPGDATATNLKDGSLLNTDETSCADGVALLTPGGSFVDAVSYEGIVANAAPFGTLFHVTPPYSIPRDDGGLAGVSIEKTTSTLARATSASEWRDPSELGSILTCQNQVGLACPTNTWTPGAENPLQDLFCPIAMPYGSPSAAFLNKPMSLID